nr:MAG TPA: hypothetical protein [Caudoviricetes sp.]
MAIIRVLRSIRIIRSALRYTFARNFNSRIRLADLLRHTIKFDPKHTTKFESS